MSREAAPDPPSMLSRAVALLDAFTADVDTLGVSELARITGQPKPTAHRLAGELVRLGMLESVDGRYRLGLRLFELGHLAASRQRLRERAAPEMLRLRELAGQTIHLAVLDGADVVYLDILPGRTRLGLPSRVGGRMPAHATAVGKALLSRAAHEVVTGVVTAPARRLTPRTIVAPGLLAADLRRSGDRGYALDLEESAVGLVCVASPVSVGGAAVAALSISGRSAEMPLPRLAPELRAAADRLGRVLADHA